MHSSFRLRHILLIMLFACSLCLSAKTTMAAEGDKNALYSQSIYHTVAPGTTLTIWMTVQNTGTTTWRKDSKEGYGYAGTGELAGRRNPLWRDVPPGPYLSNSDSIIRFEKQIVAPQKPGTYQYGIMLTRHGQPFGLHYFINITVAKAKNSSVLLPRKTWQEPNENDYNNYCGPGATKVALDIAEYPLAKIPSWDELAVMENLNPDEGVYMYDIVETLNNLLGDTYYQEVDSPDAQTFVQYVRDTLAQRKALITGVEAGGMAGWYGNPKHIVAIVGYQEFGNGQASIAYIETAALKAGYSGANTIQWVPFNLFWPHVESNNTQAVVTSSPYPVP